MRKIDKEMQQAIKCMKLNYNHKKEGRFTISEEKIIVAIIKDQMLNSIKQENNFEFQNVSKTHNNENNRRYFNKIKH